MLDIKNLLVRRGEGALAHHVRLPHLQIGAGEILAITGESGSGKSTLLEAIGLLLAPVELERFRLGPTHAQDIAHLLATDDQPALAAVRSRHLGFILQSGGLLPFLSVRDNISLPRRLLGMSAKSEHIDHVFDPRENILAGTRMLRTKANHWNGDLKLTIASYHAGVGAVTKYKGIPPYATTQQYVQWVVKAYDRYRSQEMAQASTPPNGG